MRALSLALIALCCAALFPVARTAARPGIAQELYLNFLPPNGAAIAVTPPSILLAETPIVVRYTLIGAIAIYEPQAACQPNALSFFGVRDSINPAWCKSGDENAVLQSFTLYRALYREFPVEADNFANFLRGLGLDPVSNSTDRNTMSGWANAVGDRIVKYFARDGWNSLGDRSRGFRQQFKDFTDYQPSNCATDDPRKLKRPLRWQPITQSADGRGRFNSQIHVTPHIGRTVKPLVLTEKDVQQRSVNSPYLKPNRWGFIGFGDLKITRAFLRDLISTSSSLTGGQRFLARWWNNKLHSTASISAFYESALGLTRFEVAQQFMGEMISQHDALLVAWKEKRRHDLARPRTILQNVRRGQKFRAFIDEQRGFGEVSAENWNPVIGEQPHSEFPSGSAALCTAAMEHLFFYAKAKLPPTRKVPPIEIRIPKDSMTFFMSQDRTISYNGLGEAAFSCGESRLWAGVHFRPAVTAGNKIGKGIGKIVFEHIMELGRGQKPRFCRRCL